MAKAAKKSNDIKVSPHLVFAGFLAAGFALSLLGGALPIGFGHIFTGPWGLFSNLTLAFYLLTAVLAARAGWNRRAKGERAWTPWVLLALLAIIQAGEVVSWLIPLLYADYQSWPFINLHQLAARSYEGVPAGASLKIVALIAGVRISALLAVIYGVLAAYYYRRELAAAARHPKRPALLYAGGFVLFSVSLLLMQAGIIGGLSLFGPLFGMAAAASLLTAVSGKYFLHAK